MAGQPPEQVTQTSALAILRISVVFQDLHCGLVLQILLQPAGPVQIQQSPAAGKPERKDADALRPQPEIEISQLEAKALRVAAFHVEHVCSFQSRQYRRAMCYQCFFGHSVLFGNKENKKPDLC
jgi:hypothetical protein